MAALWDALPPVYVGKVTLDAFLLAAASAPGDETAELHDTLTRFRQLAAEPARDNLPAAPISNLAEQATVTPPNDQQ